MPWGGDERQFCSPGLRPAGRGADADAARHVPGVPLVGGRPRVDHRGEPRRLARRCCSRSSTCSSGTPPTRAAAPYGEPQLGRRGLYGEISAGRAPGRGELPPRAPLGAEPRRRRRTRCSTSPSAAGCRSPRSPPPPTRSSRRICCRRPRGEGAASPATTATSARSSARCSHEAGHDVVGLDTFFYRGCDFGEVEFPFEERQADIRDVTAARARRVRRGRPFRRALERPARRPRRGPHLRHQPARDAASRRARQGGRRRALRLRVVVQHVRRGRRATTCSTSARRCGR